MTIEELYNKLLSTYPKYKDYIVDDLNYLDIFVTNNPSKQNHLTRFFRARACDSSGQVNPYLIAFPWTVEKLESTEIEDVGLNGHEPVLKFLPLDKVYERIIALWPNYEAAVQYFNKVYTELPHVIKTVQELGFEKNNNYELFESNIPANMILSVGSIDVELRFPDLYFLGYTVLIYRDGWDQLDNYESKNFEDCINFLQEAN